MQTHAHTLIASSIYCFLFHDGDDDDPQPTIYIYQKRRNRNTKADGNPTAMHVEFMQGVLPLLDQADYVYRYSWMSSRDKSGLRGLMETVDGKDQLTVLGKIYNT